MIYSFGNSINAALDFIDDCRKRKITGNLIHKVVNTMRNKFGLVESMEVTWQVVTNEKPQIGATCA